MRENPVTRFNKRLAESVEPYASIINQAMIKQSLNLYC